MTRYDLSQISLAVALSTLAGFVDAVGFLHLGGLFVSFMSGNSTSFAVGLSGQAPARTQACIGIIATFVAGVVGGELLGQAAGSRQRMAVLGCEILLLAAASVLQGIGHPVLAVGGMTLAMGVENTIFQRSGEVSIGLTYMTGTLVKTGQHIAAALKGGPRWAWMRYLALWAGLVAGGAIGAACYAMVGFAALWLATAYAAAILGFVWLSRPRAE